MLRELSLLVLLIELLAVVEGNDEDEEAEWRWLW